MSGGTADTDLRKIFRLSIILETIQREYTQILHVIIDKIRRFRSNIICLLMFFFFFFCVTEYNILRVRIEH